MTTDTPVIEIGALIAIGVNVAAVIWGAAKLSSAVEHLEKTVSDIERIVRATQEIVHNTVGRLWVVEDRLDIPHRRISDQPQNND